MSDTIPGAPPEGARVLTLPDGLDLASGKRLERVDVAYETFGTLDENGANAVLVCHALSGDSHVTSAGSDRAGWWQPMVGPGLAIDTDHLF
ncbi:MAG TPA: homoserine O-acetyltransferase, partial [Coriobacteriia bacterium]